MSSTPFSASISQNNKFHYFLGAGGASSFRAEVFDNERSTDVFKVGAIADDAFHHCAKLQAGFYKFGVGVTVWLQCVSWAVKDMLSAVQVSTTGVSK